MLLGPSEDPRATPVTGVRWRSNDRYSIGWQGVIYLPGETNGEATIDLLLGADSPAEFQRLVDALNGVYRLFVHDHPTGTWQIFSDRTALARVYYSEDRVASRFLDLLRAEQKSGSDVDDKRLVEFIFQGGNFGRETPVKGIRRLRRGQSLHVDYAKQHPVTVVERADVLADGFEPSEVLRYFDDLSRSIAGRRVSVDITGGFDSRVIACLLSKRNLSFECGLAGVVDSNEQHTANRVAAALNREMIYHVHDISTLEADLPQVFLDGDGLTEIPRLHRDRQLCLRRLARGIEVMVHGGGGEFFRDNYVIQDFPFYGVPSANIQRFYRLRVIPVALPDEQLTPAALALRHEIFTETLERFESCRASTNNETYERIYRDFRAPELFGTTFSNYLYLGMQVAAPFLEDRLIRVAMHMSPWSRFFTLWHRRMVTAHCPALAALPTTEGYTASSRPAQLAAELGTYGHVQLARIGRKLTERYLGKSLFHKVGELEADAPGYRDGLRRSKLLILAIDRLKQQGILRADLPMDELRNVHVGRMITMGTLLRYLDGEPLIANSA
jgi:asparagine synthetase B (glutamine-hydrolysing)